MVHNSCKFEIVKYYGDSVVIKIQPLCGTFTSDATEKFTTEKVENLTTNFGGGFDEWVKDNY